ncbi:hypothetical protein C8J57DRAFT_154692 [Mycena rebaudengoi]|nr:hypothetical protein C8J57DRAFT_154692 [Mycena rebaudengoi]
MPVHVLTGVTPLTLHLLKLLSWILLLLPSCLSALLYISEQDAPSSYIFFITTFIGLLYISLIIALTTVVLSLALPCRLVEPFTIYLTVLANSFRVPRDHLPRDPEPGWEWFSRGLLIPAAVLVVWNLMVEHITGSKERVIHLKYLKGILPFDLGRNADQYSRLNTIEEHSIKPGKVETV